MGVQHLLAVDLEEWHKWVVYILGDLLLLASVIGLMMRLVKRSIKKVITEETKETKERAVEASKKVDTLLEAHDQTHEQIRLLADTMAKVVYQVQPNKGGSIRDAIDRTETAVVELTAQVSVVDAKVDEARVDIAGVKGQIKGL
jgi:F0F1-type ATP synthase membrane subunit b/b'